MELAEKTDYASCLGKISCPVIPDGPELFVMFCLKSFLLNVCHSESAIPEGKKEMIKN